jgi:PAS domain S-box-containing protein
MTDYPNLVRPFRSLRLRLLLVSVVVETVMLSLLVANGARLIHDHLARNTLTRVAAQEASFNITLAGQLAERDYASAQSVIEGWRGNSSITYMVVEDASGRVVAATGRKASDPLPAPDPVLDDNALIYNGAFEIEYLGQRYGRAQYGLDTAFLGEAQRQLISQSVGIAIAEVVMTLGLLAIIGYWLTRHLAMLTRASLRVASGDFSQRLEPKGGDEIAVLTQAFNTMSEAVDSRISELEDSQRRFRAIADYTHAWENWFDVDGHLRWVNPAVSRISGYSVPECHAMADFPLPLVVEDDRAVMAAHMEDARAGGSGQDVEFRLLRRDGGIIWAAMSWQPIFDQDGNPLGSRSSIRDIDLQKRSADLLLDAKSELERMLFAASHDLQEPVRYVLSYSQRLERDLSNDLSEEARSSLKIIRDAADQMSLLVKGLANYNRSTRPMATFGQVDLKALVDRAAAECCTRAGTRAIRFEVGPLPSIHGDPAMLLILFENIIGNAVKFADPDRVPEIHVSAQVEEPGWRIDIADNGIGIEAQDLVTVIRPFSRLHSRSAYPGAGLGLASAQKVARMHDGRLWLDSVPGQGTTVHLWFPRVVV